ncbi:MAG TPA: type II toxin-antitoxin system VapC family toxin [Thermoanaerobaculia bacterium]|nr:type II toxin-antitoxin system VapC family toxin [Thermoanaerobaculia bacterium]
MTPPEKRSCVLDASALLALLQGEPGGERVEEFLETAAISSVNWSEVMQKALDWQTEIEGLRQELEVLGLEILPFTAVLAETTAHLRASTRQAGLSLGDRACLALASTLNLPAFTTDRIWPDLGLPIEIRVLR